jgi:hypothetical protein
MTERKNMYVIDIWKIVIFRVKSIKSQNDPIKKYDKSNYCVIISLVRLMKFAFPF